MSTILANQVKEAAHGFAQILAESMKEVWQGLGHKSQNSVAETPRATMGQQLNELESFRPRAGG